MSECGFTGGVVKNGVTWKSLGGVEQGVCSIEKESTTRYSCDAKDMTEDIKNHPSTPNLRKFSSLIPQHYYKYNFLST